MRGAWTLVLLVAAACGGISGSDGDSEDIGRDAGDEPGRPERPDAAPGADADPGPGDQEPVPVRLTNSAACVGSTTTAPLPANIGHWAAARLSVASGGPATITSIEYNVLFLTNACSSTVAHNVQVFAVGAASPPGTPSPIVAASVPAGGVAGQARRVIVALPAPVTVGAGDQLFVAIQMTGTTGATLCVESCFNPSGQDDRNYWSNAIAPPYPWATLASFGNDTDLMIDAVGTSP